MAEQEILNIDEKEGDKFKSESYFCTLYFNWGILEEMFLNLSNAVALYQKVIAINPFYFDAHNRLAYILFQTGNSQGALEICDQAIAKFEESKA